MSLFLWAGKKKNLSCLQDSSDLPIGLPLSDLKNRIGFHIGKFQLGVPCHEWLILCNISAPVALLVLGYSQSHLLSRRKYPPPSVQEASSQHPPTIPQLVVMESRGELLEETLILLPIFPFPYQVNRLLQYQHHDHPEDLRVFQDLPRRAATSLGMQMRTSHQTSAISYH